MRSMLLATATLLALGGTSVAQTADTGPMSTKATHIDKADAGSSISPRLPSPGLGQNATPDDFLAKAKADVQAGRTGAAQEALEMAETRLLDRSTQPQSAATPDPNPRIGHIRDALHALPGRNKAATIASIDAAMSGGGDASTSAPAGQSTGQSMGQSMGQSTGQPMAAKPMPMPMPMTGAPNPINLPIAPGGTSGTTPATATGGSATGTGQIPTAVGGNASGGGASSSSGPVTP